MVGASVDTDLASTDGLVDIASLAASGFCPSDGVVDATSADSVWTSAWALTGVCRRSTTLSSACTTRARDVEPIGRRLIGI